jgi:hypothetical protein
MNNLYDAKKLTNPTIMSLTSHKLISQSQMIHEPLSDSEILQIQDIFLTKGIHSIKVHDIQSGRIVMKRFLESLNCYHAIACLTMTEPIIGINIIDLYSELLTGNYCAALHEQSLTDFFINQFNYDFLWIEASEQLLNSLWFTCFEQALFNLNIQTRMPIFVVTSQ